MTQLWAQTASELTSAYATGAASPVEAVKSVFERIDQVNPRINALFAEMRDEPIARAVESEARWRRGAAVSPIDGVPMTVKDSIAMAGTPYWRGCRANMDNPTSTVDSPPARRLKSAGAIIVAKTTMPDFGMLGAGVSSAHGVTRNPWNLAFNTGGSSSGGAAAVAAGCGALTVGTDMAGSVRLPAAMCGMVGLKPTQGRIPHLPPSQLRSAGPIARTVKDAAILFTILSGADDRDFGSLPPTPVVYERSLDRPLRGLRFGLLKEAGFGLEVQPAVRAAMENLMQLAAGEGADVKSIERLLSYDPLDDIGIIFALRSGLEYEALPASRKDEILPYALSLCQQAGSYSALQYAHALAALERAKTDVLSHFDDIDYLITPALPVVGFPAEAIGANPQRPMEHLNLLAMFNQTGQPAVSVNCGISAEGLPIGIQIVGRRFDDLGVLQVAAAFEEMLGFKTTLAPLS
jgi:aspartyl-tRNA(Asn)/glutamyl-tRNA(Gln) amidotransferase subunit A